VNALILALIATVMLSGWAVDEGWLPRLAKLAPEAVSGVVLVIVIALGARDRFRNVRPAYWLVFASAALSLAFGAMANAVDPGPLVSALRNYARAVPLFFLPAVYLFGDRQLRTQLLLILLLCMPQFPLAWQQRQTALAWGNTSGDEVVGTLLLSGALSVFLIAVACVLLGFHLKGRLRLACLLLLLAIVLAPTLVNETKATLVMLPVAMFATFLATAQPGARLKYTVAATAFVAAFVAAFVPVYDHFVAKRDSGVPIAEFFTDRDHLRRYMGEGVPVGATEAGRTDAVLTPLSYNARDPVQFALGLGPGNVTLSPLGHGFSGEYARKLEPFLKSTVSLLIMEGGLLALGLALALNWLVFQDARVVARSGNDLTAALAAGWVGVAVTVALGSFYANLVAHEAISYLFWFFSGVVAARRMRLAR
jgi:hypothetical protein